MKKKLILRDIDTNKHAGEHSDDDGHNHSSPESVTKFKTYLPAVFSFIMLLEESLWIILTLAFSRIGYASRGM
jgi:hypothetical protein